MTISGTPVITGNEAAQGGAVYVDGTVSVTGGSMTGNAATEKGGAVYVANGKTFTMSGGSIKDGNKSPEGAVSTDVNATLAFSGNAVVSGNTDTDGTTVKNVYLGYDSNAIITSAGLGSSANIGVYVADGDPETEDPENPLYREDHVNNPIYADHGVGGRDFGTYTGSNINSARLNKFVNDRDTALTGMNGSASGGNQYIAWIGKGLTLRVTQYLIQTDSEGNPVLDDKGDPVFSEEVVPVQNASFTFTRDVEGENDVQVWSGMSSTEGIVTIPWGGNETADGNVASFVPGSVYRLDQTAADGKTVLPAGHWRVAIGRDNSVTWEVVPVAGDVDRTLKIDLPAKAFLGETFGLKNDVKPTLTYHVNGEGKLADDSSERTDIIAFTTRETSHSYTIRETNPTWDSHVFKAWATMDEKPKGENGEELTEEQLTDKGYFEYVRENSITFYRGTDSADPAVKYAKETSKGNMTLYAQWDEVVCKITDRSGTLLYINGSPAVYGSLEKCFDAYNAANAYSFTYKNGTRATARMIEMLVGEYELNDPVELERGKTVMLTTAPKTDTDGYAYTGEEGSVCVITRGEGCDSSMISNHSNLTLMNVTLDGDGHRDDRVKDRVIVTDGGIVNNVQTSAVLTIAKGATLRNSFVEGNGGAVNAIASTTVYLTGGVISGNSSSGDSGANGNGNGAGIFLAKGSRLYLSGNPSFADNLSNAALPLDAKNGGEEYTQARQDIYLAGSADDGEALTSITLNGNLADTVQPGSIWVWAEGNDNTEPNHYYMLKQFAVVSFTGTVSEATCKAFRNARADADTGCGGDYLTGQKGEHENWIYWTGGFDVVFLKTDGFGQPLPGATFTLYTDEACTAAYDMSFTGSTPVSADGKRATTVSSDGNATYKDKNGVTQTLKAGEVLLAKVAPRTYYMKETELPGSAYAESNKDVVYKVTVSGTGELTMAKKASEADTSYMEVYKVGSGADAQYRVMNTFFTERKVVLRKVSNTDEALGGAQFRIFTADLTEVIDEAAGYDRTSHCYTSALSGVYFVGTLPYGLYYLVEIGTPTQENGLHTTAYSNNTGKVFRLELTDNTGERIVSTESVDVSDPDRVVGALKAMINP